MQARCALDTRDSGHPRGVWGHAPQEKTSSFRISEINSDSLYAFLCMRAITCSVAFSARSARSREIRKPATPG